MSLQEFTQACFECAEWAESGEIDFSDHEWSRDFRAQLEADCQSFWQSYGYLIERIDPDNEYSSAELAGHDFWLTRNGHGAGFWDRGGLWGTHEDALVKGAETYDELSLYLGDDGLIYA